MKTKGRALKELAEVFHTSKLRNANTAKTKIRTARDQDEKGNKKVLSSERSSILQLEIGVAQRLDPLRDTESRFT